MIPIILADGVTKVWLSIEDVEDALKYSWTLTRSGYPWGHVNGNRIYLHRWVADRVGLALDEVIDHIDRNPLNATRDNLRYTRQQLNCFNASRRLDNTSGYKGVSWSKVRKTWRAYITRDGKQTSLGHFDDPISAAVAYDRAAIKLFGEEFAATNLKLGLIKEEDYGLARPARPCDRKTATSSTGFRGVSRDRKGFRASVYLNGKSIHLKTLPTALEAAEVYDQYVIENGLPKVTNKSLGLL